MNVRRHYRKYATSTPTSLPFRVYIALGVRNHINRAYIWYAPLALALGLAAMSPGLSAATSEPPLLSNEGYATDLRAYLDKIHWYEHALAKMPRLDDSSNREFISAFGMSETPDEFYARAMPIFESYISPKDAHTLGLMARQRPVSLKDEHAALEAFATIDEHAMPKLRHVWDALMDAFSQRILDRAVVAVRSSIADMATHTEPDYVPSVGRVGLSYLDKLDVLIVNLYARQWNASKLQERGCHAASPDIALAPSTLLGQDGFAAAYRALDECEHALQTQDLSNEAAFKDFTSKVQAMQLSDGSSSPKAMEQIAFAVHKRAQELSGLHRQLLVDQRRLVDLIEARGDHVHIEDGQLVFESDRDVEQVNHIVDDIVAHDAAINDFIYQVRQNSALLRGIDMHDGISAPVEPAVNRN